LVLDECEFSEVIAALVLPNLDGLLAFFHHFGGYELTLTDHVEAITRLSLSDDVVTRLEPLLPHTVTYLGQLVGVH
jgi:hypothetical protein